MELENLADATTAWSIRISMMCLFGACTCRLLNRRMTQPDSENRIAVGACLAQVVPFE